MGSDKFAYVDVPRSPYPTKRSAIQHLPLSPRLRKENQPGNAPASLQIQSPLSSKRPFAHIDASASSNHATVAKKAKLLPSSDPPSGDNARCHHCGKRRLVETIQCTWLHLRKSTGHLLRCNMSYCAPCLKKRFQMDIQSLKTASSAGHAGHFSEESYAWKCPKCSGNCQCSSCRRSKGSEAGRNVRAQVPSTEAGHRPKKTLSRKPARTRPAPIVNWTTIDTPLSWDEFQNRVFVREFMVRFGSYLDPPLAKGKIEELDQFVATGAFEDLELVPWVGSEIVKSMLLGLLGLIAAEENKDIRQIVKAVISDIRNSAGHLTKCWGALAALRQHCTQDDEDYDEDKLCLTFRDPLPPPAGRSHFTRTSTAAVETAIVHSAQMIPVIIDLIQAALLTSVIRQAIDDGAQDNKDLVREKLDASKKEAQRWKAIEESARETEPEPNSQEKAPNKNNDSKAESEKHNNSTEQTQRSAALESAFQVLSHSNFPRFSPLGTDHDGRIYFALSPGIYDQEAARKTLTSFLSDSQKLPKSSFSNRYALSEEEASRFRRWSWFLVVYGDHPPSAQVEFAESTDTSPRFWGFSNPAEINKLAEWISISSSHDVSAQGDDQPANEGRNTNVVRLVKALRSYANTLRWRLKPEKPE